jgi:mycoredoxin
MAWHSRGRYRSADQSGGGAIDPEPPAPCVLFRPWPGVGRAGNEPLTSRVAVTMAPSNHVEQITVYWRPGCMYCARLRRGLRRAGLVTTEVNIWSDPTAAGLVRRVANGNETVPTVVVGGTSLVNPSTAEVLDPAVRAGIPTHVTPSRTPDRSLSSALVVLQWMAVAALLAASLALDRSGHPGVSWGLDGVVLAIYFVIRALRRRVERRGTS